MDKRIERTEKLLTEGLIKLMKKKYVNTITVKELTELVNINRCTFYLHYEDIYDLLEKIEDNIINRMINVFDNYDSLKVNGNSLPAIRDIFTIIEEDKDACDVLLNRSGDVRFEKKVEKKLINHFKANKLLIAKDEIDEIDYDYYYQFIVSGLIGLAKKWIKNDLKESKEHVAKLAEGICLNGLQRF